MDGLLLQDFITVTAAGATMTQGSDSWLDVSAYEDLFFYLDVKNIDAPGLVMGYQTSPTLDDVSFVNMITAVPLAVGIRSDAAIAAFCVVPAANYVRWQIPLLGGTGFVTFRIVVAGYSLEC